VRLVACPQAARGGFRRAWFDQVSLPQLLRDRKGAVLYSSANLGPLRCSCRHVLLVRNPIYFSPDYRARVTSPRARSRLALQRWLTLRCIEAADRVLFPTRAMRDMAVAHGARLDGKSIVAPYGTRLDLFRAEQAPGETPPRDGGAVRLLHVSHYCDQKNLGTLLRALRILADRAPGYASLTITSDLRRRAQAPPASCPALVEDLRLFGELSALGLARDLGSVPYAELPSAYRAASLFVFPSYTESFGHPLVEAMATGLPIVAADTPVNREMCGDAAMYFETFSPEALAEAVVRTAGHGALGPGSNQAAMARARQRFTWQNHVAALRAALTGTGAAAMGCA
jgi:glycosyltransferase involved in cell wall biosynthesis